LVNNDRTINVAACRMKIERATVPDRSICNPIRAMLVSGGMRENK
jgi:hypothetical protein